MPTNRPTRDQVKRARAEAARAAAARAQRRARNLRIGLWSGAAVVVAAAVAIVIVLANRPDNGQPASAPATTGPAATAAAGGRTTNPPWGVPADASAAVAAAGLPMLGAEGTALHIHAHLDIIVDGKSEPVAAEIGIDEAKQKISPLHSHDTTGVIHIESPNKNDTFTLGQFFTEWQVALSADHLGGLATDATHHLTAYVNGAARLGDPAAIVLGAHDEIALVYGTDAEHPTVPSSYQWTNGL